MTLFFLALILISSLGIAFILGSKVYEAKSAQAGVMSRASLYMDHKLNNFFDSVASFISEINHANARKTFVTLSHGLFHIFGTAGLFVSKHHKIFKEKIVNGHGTIKKKGVVSFFLKDVAESREKKDLSE